MDEYYHYERPSSRAPLIVALLISIGGFYLLYRCLDSYYKYGT
ncbi:hypothetical protein ACCO45_004052 [Purpureocillium lilacinum]|uniref:Uncharacterized protein n=1 Tax=Purpureocillium lilacinum TaxID=33203 RepID=A0ACC4E313_PURLI